MANRLAVQASREALYEALRKACLDGTLTPGSLLPGVRDLGQRYGVSTNVVYQVIQRLTDEGTLYTVPRVGTFIGQGRPEASGPYLMLLPPHEAGRENYMAQVQSGFEDRIAQLGGRSIVLSPEESQLHLEAGDLPQISGVFESLESSLTGNRIFTSASVPAVIFGSLDEGNGGQMDHVSFDDTGGGAQATGHLWQMGHRRIAFLGLHPNSDAGPFSWSWRREMGWRQSLEQLGCETEGLCYHPRTLSGLWFEEQIEAACEAAGELVRRTDISAVVVANSWATEGLFRAYQQVNLPPGQWPSVVSFDATQGASSSVVSYLRLPWEEIGREAAQVLWERSTGQLSGPPVQCLVTMRLVRRLSCKPDWAATSNLLQHRYASSVPSPGGMATELVSGPISMPLQRA